MYRKQKIICSLLLLIFLISFSSIYLPAQPKKPLTVQDMMKFKQIRNPIISADGKWIAYNAQPDRGDGKVNIHPVKGKKVLTIDRGEKPAFSHDSKWLASFVKPAFVELEKKAKDKPKPGMALLNTSSGETVQFEAVQNFQFSEDSKWLAIHYFKKEKKPDSTQQIKNKKNKEKKNIGTDLLLHNLESGKEIEFPFVRSFSFDSTAYYFVFVAADTSGKENGIYYIDLKQNNPAEKKVITQGENSDYGNLSWNNKGKLAFTSAEHNNEKVTPASLWTWDGPKAIASEIIKTGETPEGWLVPMKNQLSWSKDGNRLFFGLKPDTEALEDTTQKDEKEEADIYDIEALLKKKEVDVWHWNDPWIVPHQKKMWSRLKDRTYQAVYHFESSKLIQLADENMPIIRLNENSDFALGLSDVPYRKDITWEGSFNDIYLVNLKNGVRKKIISRLNRNPFISPNAHFVLYYKDKNWHLYDCMKETTRNLTIDLNVPFYNEDHDYPSPVPGYGIGGWIENDEAILIYDKYDIWQFPAGAGSAFNLTNSEGRNKNITFRIQNLDPEQRFFKDKEELLLLSYHNLKKNNGFYTCKVGKTGITKIIEEDKLYKIKSKSRDSDLIMYTRESYTEFPDLWVTDTKFKSPRKITNVNPQVKEFAWGSAELVEWNSLDGTPLQGVLIKPGNYEKGNRYPVLVYYYRFFSQRLHEFNQVVVNHRPCFPFYASNGYAIFLPDIRFEVGYPGFSATKCIVPGIQKLIDLGIADPKAIALHGHSWSGYQTAFVITQTDIFACAIAGAPVSNMTSAYSGIRWGSGMARQFQYEQSQSRIGGSLWEYPERYIENSPVFFADRIQTPLLIQFGDKNGAVPWYQGIELYLAMRRLNKDCVFLQYRGEPHHLQKYPNKLDYTMKMKEYLDHYCKDEPAPDWITKGILYQGK